MTIDEQLEIAARVASLEKEGFTFKREGDCFGDWFTLTGFGVTSKPILTLREAEMFAEGVISARSAK